MAPLNSSLHSYKKHNTVVRFNLQDYEQSALFKSYHLSKYTIAILGYELSDFKPSKMNELDLRL